MNSLEELINLDDVLVSGKILVRCITGGAGFWRKAYLTLLFDNYQFPLNSVNDVEYCVKSNTSANWPYPSNYRNVKILLKFNGSEGDFEKLSQNYATINEFIQSYQVKNPEAMRSRAPACTSLEGRTMIRPSPWFGFSGYIPLGWSKYFGTRQKCWLPVNCHCIAYLKWLVLYCVNFTSITILENLAVNSSQTLLFQQLPVSFAINFKFNTMCYKTLPIWTCLFLTSLCILAVALLYTSHSLGFLKHTKFVFTPGRWH